MGGSFQSGYHITGLSSPSPYIQRFINSSWYERHKEPPPAHTVTMIWSLIVSMYAVGGFFGAISVKFFSGRLGRKKAMIGNSVIAIVAAGIMLTSKRANSFEMIIVARILFGFSAGKANETYSISPRKIRGAVTLTLATFMSLGKLSGQFFGLSEILGREELWDIVLCVPACFSVVHVIVLPFLPEAPRYLFIEKGDDKACKKALQSLWGTGDYKQEMDEMLIEQAAIEAAPPKNPLQLLRDRTVRWQLITMSLIYCCNQLSGITFSFDIFLKVGIPRDKIRYVTLGLGVSEIITSISCFIRVGNVVDLTLEWLEKRCLYAWTVNPIISVLPLVYPAGASATLNSEIFIQSDRLAALVLMGIQRWLLFAVLGLVFPFLINGLSTYCFVLFACVCLLGCFYTFFLLPETKGKTLLEISEEFKAITLCGKSFSETERVETKL
uniref:Solute carrier family 2, facilitated glucose transporter member 5 n=1 Tax=Lates calcarifer TaxID=8187 RepID=A0A4W6D6C9_LATCA